MKRKEPHYKYRSAIIGRERHKEKLLKHYERRNGLKALLATVVEQDVYDPASIKDLERKIAKETRAIINMSGDFDQEQNDPASGKTLVELYREGKL